MTAKDLVESNEKLKVSILSKCAYIISIGAYALAISGWVFRDSEPAIGNIAPFVLLGSIAVTSILSIVDIVMKNRRRWLAITLLALNGIYALLFAAVMIIFKINGAGSL